MIIAGTGHRPNKLGGYSQEAFERLVKVATYAINKYEPTKVISGMALGWDQALAQAAITLGVPLIAAVPFQGQESMWPPESQRSYHTLCDKASELVHVCEPGYAAWKMQKRNEWMVDRADCIWAVWDGQEYGGTWNCIAYAKSLPNKQVLNFFPVWKKF